MKVAIIGAGITGLSIGYYLAKAGVKADIFESQNYVGGLAGTFEHEGFKVDRFYHHFYTRDTHLIKLIRELGLGSNIIWEATPTGMYYANNIYRLSSPMDLLKFKPLPFFDRLKMGLLVLKANRHKDLSRLENISAKDWLIREAGKNVYNVMWEPLLRNKFGQYADEISAAWIWSKFNKRGGSRSKGGAEKLGYIKGGLGIFLQRLEKTLKDKGVKIKKSSKVKSIVVSKNKANGIILESGDKIGGYDSIVSSLSTELTAKLIDCHDQEYQNSLERVKYLANVTFIMLLKKSLSNCYWLNVNDPQCPFVGVIEHTKLIDIDEYSGLHLVYIPKYLTKDSRLFAADKDEIYKEYIPWLKKIFPDFKETDIAYTHVCRDLYTQPIIEKNYRRLIPDTKTPINGFFNVCMAQIYPEDRQVSNAVRDGKAFAEKISKKKL